jgi:UTP--glucose-1-phosphate uridylyltransferase
MPKEMLPVVDKPAIQYVVEEAVSAGIDDVLIILGRNKNNISNHFDSVPSSSRTLLTKGDHDKLARVRRRQSSPTSTSCARVSRRASATPCCAPSTTSATRPRGAARRRPDRRERDPLLTTMLAGERERTGLTVIALMEVDPEHIHLYGAAEVELTDGPTSSA